ncbi:hypothetical protein N7456_007008 [Penicillium angulare]|uniref:Uncharacterized protein n=1 Tax=Penicillium angulare TaxID=116970 RepID=A0A9W9KC11_9EURO|nr:hypothetical protein N7456_006806 [Penicillium angulare]KAJ5100956.1 hypothetical protein N7456_007008 [Penicillium angulare]
MTPPDRPPTESRKQPLLAEFKNLIEAPERDRIFMRRAVSPQNIHGSILKNRERTSSHRDKSENRPLKRVRFELASQGSLKESVCRSGQKTASWPSRRKSTTKRCLQRLETLVVADVPAETLGFADVPAEALGDAFFLAENLFDAAVSCRELVNAAVSCGSQLSSQHPPAEFTCNSRRHGNLRPEGPRRHTAVAMCEERAMDRGRSLLLWNSATLSRRYQQCKFLTGDGSGGRCNVFTLNHELDGASDWIANHVAPDSTTTIHSIWCGSNHKIGAVAIGGQRASSPMVHSSGTMTSEKRVRVKVLSIMLRVRSALVEECGQAIGLL